MIQAGGSTQGRLKRVALWAPTTYLEFPSRVRVMRTSLELPVLLVGPFLPRTDDEGLRSQATFSPCCDSSVAEQSLCKVQDVGFDSLLAAPTRRECNGTG